MFFHLLRPVGTIPESIRPQRGSSDGMLSADPRRRQFSWGRRDQMEDGSARGVRERSHGIIRIGQRRSEEEGEGGPLPWGASAVGHSPNLPLTDRCRKGKLVMGLTRGPVLCCDDALSAEGDLTKASRITDTLPGGTWVFTPPCLTQTRRRILC